MQRVRLIGLLLLLSGCQLPPETAPLRPLPENLQQTYQELYRRARRQAEMITAACYDNEWITMEDAAKGLQQTARHLAKATDIPPSLKDQAARLMELDEISQKVSKAAISKDEKVATAALTELTRIIRKIRPPDDLPAPPARDGRP